MVHHGGGARLCGDGRQLDQRGVGERGVGDDGKVDGAGLEVR
jgi:hypothetical protein